MTDRSPKNEDGTPDWDTISEMLDVAIERGDKLMKIHEECAGVVLADYRGRPVVTAAELAARIMRMASG